MKKFQDGGITAIDVTGTRSGGRNYAGRDDTGVYAPGPSAYGPGMSGEAMEQEASDYLEALEAKMLRELSQPYYTPEQQREKDRVAANEVIATLNGRELTLGEYEKDPEKWDKEIDNAKAMDNLEQKRQNLEEARDQRFKGLITTSPQGEKESDVEYAKRVEADRISNIEAEADWNALREKRSESGSFAPDVPDDATGLFGPDYNQAKNEFDTALQNVLDRGLEPDTRTWLEKLGPQLNRASDYTGIPLPDFVFGGPAGITGTWGTPTGTPVGTTTVPGTAGSTWGGGPTRAGVVTGIPAIDLILSQRNPDGDSRFGLPTLEDITEILTETGGISGVLKTPPDVKGFNPDTGEKDDETKFGIDLTPEEAARIAAEEAARIAAEEAARIAAEEAADLNVDKTGDTPEVDGDLNVDKTGDTPKVGGDLNKASTPAGGGGGGGGQRMSTTEGGPKGKVDLDYLFDISGDSIFAPRSAYKDDGESDSERPYIYAGGGSVQKDSDFIEEALEMLRRPVQKFHAGGVPGHPHPLTDWVKDNPVPVSLIGGLFGLAGGSGDSKGSSGYAGSIPNYTADRDRLAPAPDPLTPVTDPTNAEYNPYAIGDTMGKDYFSPMKYTLPEAVDGGYNQVMGGGNLRDYNDMLETDVAAAGTDKAAQDAWLAKFLENQMQNPELGDSAPPAPDTVPPVPRGTTMTRNEDDIFVYDAPNQLTDAALLTSIDELQNHSGLEGKELVDHAVSIFVANGVDPYRIASLTGMPLANVQKAYKKRGYNQGGLASLGGQGYYLGGPTDGMADQIPATIDNSQPAALSDGEFVIPADVVSHFGNGNSDAGARELYSMMDNIRNDRTGSTKQGKQINPKNYFLS